MAHGPLRYIIKVLRFRLTIERFRQQGDGKGLDKHLIDYVVTWYNIHMSPESTYCIKSARRTRYIIKYRIFITI